MGTIHDPANLTLEKNQIMKKNQLIYHHHKVMKKISQLPSRLLPKGFKEGKRLKILTPFKLLNRHPTLLAQIKTENKSNKLKNETRKISVSFASA